MSDQPDLDELARRYLDLWQDQVTALASDPDMIDAVQRMLAMMGGMAPFAGMPGQMAGAGMPGGGMPGAGMPGWAAWGQQAQPGAMGAGPMGAPMGGMGAPNAMGGMPWAQLWPAAMMAAMASSQGAGGGMPPGAPPTAGPGAGTPAEHGGNGQATWAASAAAASGHGTHDLDQLLRRLAGLEERVASLESGPERAQRDPETGSGEGQS